MDQAQASFIARQSAHSDSQTRQRQLQYNSFMFQRSLLRMDNREGQAYTCKAHCQTYITINLNEHTIYLIYTQCILGSNTVLLSCCTLHTAINCANTVLDEWTLACYNYPRNNIRFHLSNITIISLMAMHSHNLKL